MSFSQNVEHYLGPEDNPPTLSTALLQEQGQTNCPQKFCLYPISRDKICGQIITCQSLSMHMRSEHGVLEKSEDESDKYVCCGWNWKCRKLINRHNIYRHYKEAHLGHKRGAGHSETSIS